MCVSRVVGVSCDVMYVVCLLSVCLCIVLYFVCDYVCVCVFV